jgi:hypothetical protein
MIFVSTPPLEERAAATIWSSAASTWFHGCPCIEPLRSTIGMNSALRAANLELVMRTVARTSSLAGSAERSKSTDHSWDGLVGTAAAAAVSAACC